MKTNGAKAGIPYGDLPMTFAAIAESLDLSERTVVYAYSEAMRKIREDLPNALAWMQVLASDLKAERAARLGF